MPRFKHVRSAFSVAALVLFAKFTPIGFAQSNEPTSATAPAGRATSNAAAATPPRAESYLQEGKLAAGESALREILKGSPRDDQARFGLAAIQLVRGVERLVQSIQRHGPRTPGLLRALGPLPSLPVESSSKPEPIRYEQLRAIFEAWSGDLTGVEKTLSEIRDAEVKLPLHFGLIRLDVDGDGTASEKEVFGKLYAAVSGEPDAANGAADFVIVFDRADVDWLRGYCHLLMALSEFVLAYDEQEWFERCGHLLFARVTSPHEFLSLRRGMSGRDPFDFAEIADVIAAIHLINFPLKEPKRMTLALEHLEAMLKHSREMWQLADAETDDDHEWIPNPRQSGVITGVRITPDMWKGWQEFLDEAAALLNGEKLIPFWRDAGGRGVNLRRVFSEPRAFDLVLWVQGTAATPYLQEGQVTKKDTWDRLQRLFEGNFIGFAAWFN